MRESALTERRRTHASKVRKLIKEPQSSNVSAWRRP